MDDQEPFDSTASFGYLFLLLASMCGAVAMALWGLAGWTAKRTGWPAVLLVTGGAVALLCAYF